ncbi:MAG: O-antigen ligase family protein, partial [Lachnospiraceae bacterium]|nr:O-antigen ligase family protein [Lachnospiraceae bacterium]
MAEKLKSIDKNRLMFVIVIVAISENMAFARNHVMSHFCLMAVIWSICVIAQRKIRLDIGDVLIFFGMMLFMWQYRGWIPEGLAYGAMCMTVYQVGKLIAGGVRPYNSVVPAGVNESEESVTRIMDLVIIMSIALFIRGLLNYRYVLKWRSKVQEFSLKFRLEKDLYDEPLPRTMQAFYLVLVASLLIFFIYLLRKSIAIGIMGIILSAAAIWLDIENKGRMVVCCAIVTLAVVLVAAGIEKKLYKRRWMQIAVAVALAGLVALIIAIWTDFYGLRDWYENSFWVRDGGIVGNVRFQIMKNALLEMKEHPFSGSNEALFVTSREAISSLAHNSWLDIGVNSGVIPFILTVGFTLTNIISIFYIWQNCPDGRKYV